jgi:hypothetical protein
MHNNQETDMATSRLIPAATAIAALIALVAITAFHSPAPIATKPEAAPLPDTLHKLAQEPGSRLPTMAPAAIDSPVGPAQGGNTGEMEESKEAMLMFNRRFRAETLDPEWAAEHERVIASAVVGSKHDGFDVPPPAEIDVQCRSSTCSIRMTYADETDAANMQARLLLGMPAELSKAVTFAVPNPNGNTELQIFAGNQASLF